MTFSSAAPAQRLARPRWRNPRLIVGVVLVLASMVAGGRFYQRADDSSAVWATTHELAPGIPVQSSDLQVRHVRLDAGLTNYVSAAGPAPVGKVIARPLAAGELLPAAALTDPGAVNLRNVPVRVSTTVGLTRGSIVDVYGLPQGTATKPGAQPRLLAEKVTVAAVDSGSKSFGGAASGEVLLVLSTPQVTAVLQAQGAGEIRLARVTTPQLPGDAAGAGR